MATIVYKNAVILFKGFDLSGDMNSCTLNYSVEVLDSTTFGATARTKRGGFVTTSVDASGFVDYAAGELENALYPALGADDAIVTVFANGITEGTTTDKGYAFVAGVYQYTTGGAIGILTPFTTKFEMRQSANLAA